MAKELGKAKSLRQLREEIDASRGRVTREIEGLRYELDFPLKFRKSFQRKTVVWVGAAIVVGVAMAVMPARTKKVRVATKARKGPAEDILGAGLALSALRLAVTLFRPAITKFISRKLSGYAAERS